MKTSEHAFIRWLERVKGIPVDVFKDEMLKEFPPYLPDGVHSSGGQKWVIQNNVIVTIKPGN